MIRSRLCREARWAEKDNEHLGSINRTYTGIWENEHGIE